MTEEVKKLTLKAIGAAGSIELIGTVVALWHVEASGYFEKEAQYGPSYCVTGDITAINNIDGTVWNAPSAYLPGDAMARMKAALDARKDPNDVVIWDFQVSIAASTAQSGYTYVIRDVQTPESINKRRMIADLLQAKLKALPAPKEAPTERKAKKAA